MTTNQPELDRSAQSPVPTHKGGGRGRRSKRNFSETLLALKSAQKPGVGVPAYTRWVNRGLARYAAALATAAGISANAVSAVSGVLSLAGLALLVLLPPVLSTGILAAVLLAAGYILDSADGQVARVTKTGSPAGEWLDHVIDAVRVPATHLAVAVGFVRLYGVQGWQWWLPLIYCILAACHFMSQILAEQLLRVAKNNTSPTRPEQAGMPAEDGVSVTGKLRSWLMLVTDTGVLCWVFVLWGFHATFLTVYALLLLANGTSAIISMVRKYRALTNLGTRS